MELASKCETYAHFARVSGEPVGVSRRTIRFVFRPGADAHRLALGCGFAALKA
jgi:hypothetical protein